MALLIEGFMREEVILNHLSAHEKLQWEGCKHVQAKGKARDVDQGIILREIIEDIALCSVREDHIRRDGQCHTRHERHKG